MISEEQLNELEQLVNNLTERPWYFSENTALCQFLGTDNARFFCAARNIVPDLIARIRELEEEANYLAGNRYKLDCPKEHLRLPDCKMNYDKCMECWRKAAEKDLHHD